MGYYDAIGALATFDASNQVSFSQAQLKHLVNEENLQRKERDELKNIEANTPLRVPLHEYLGQLSKTQLETASKNAGIILGHNLLGPYVPRHELEVLSANDFAAFFEKQQFGQGKSALDRVSMISSIDDSPSSATSQSTEDNQSHLLDEPSFKKALVCSTCKSRFSGPRKSSEYDNHRCLGM